MFNCELVLLNKTEWLQHASKMIESNRSKNNEELLKDVLTFDFEFGTIPICWNIYISVSHSAGFFYFMRRKGDYIWAILKPES